MRCALTGLAMAMLGLAACSSVGDPAVEYSVEDSLGEFGTGSERDISASFVEALGTADRIHFAFDSALIDPEAEAVVHQWSAFLQQYPDILVVVQGHCDERGSREYNLALGERRAAAVEAMLVALGIDGGRIATISYGKERPAVEGHSEEVWAQNRRAVLTPG